MYLQKVWAPCFTLRGSNQVTLEKGAYIIAVFTGFMHVVSLFYAIYLLDGGRSDNFYSPAFEFGKTGTKVFSIGLLLYSLFFIVGCSIGLIHGVKSETRFFYLPWIWCSLFELLFMISFGIFMVYRYWHYGWAHFAALSTWFYSGWHFYCFWAVVSLYQRLKDLQEPTFIVIHPSYLEYGYSSYY